MIVPKNTPVGVLFNTDARLQVPKYQRSYAWGKNELLDMMTDLKTAMSDESAIFLGNFVFDVSEPEVYKIVDGQQRLTSITLLLIACRERAKGLGNHALSQEIQKKISFTDATTGEMVSERVLTSPSISDVFTFISKDSWDGNFPAKIGAKSVKRQSNKLKSLYSYMKSELSAFDSAALSKFLKAIYASYVIQIDIQSQEEAFDIFERMNARGMSLTAADLVKNYLYSHLLDTQDIETQWEDIARNADGTLQRMLKYFWVSRKGYVLGTELYRKLKQYGQSEGAANVTNQLARFSSYYAAIRSDDEAKIAEWLRLEGCDGVAANHEYLKQVVAAAQGLNLFKITQHYPLIYSIIKAYEGTDRTTGDSKVLIALLRNIERYHFVNNQICERVGNEVEKPYAEFSLEFFETRDFRACANKFTIMLRDKLAKEAEFVPRFMELDYDNLTIAETCYIFDRINNSSLNASEWVKVYDPDPLITKKNYNTEHFLSQNPDYAVAAEDMEVVGNIGNLFIISRHTNSRLQNRPPVEKIPLLKERGGQLAYVTKFVRDFEVSDRSWGKTKIVQRAKDLAEKAYRDVWKID